MIPVRENSEVVIIYPDQCNGGKVLLHGDDEERPGP
jgi:hypothetical protein